MVRSVSQVNRQGGRFGLTPSAVTVVVDFVLAHARALTILVARGG